MKYYGRDNIQGKLKNYFFSFLLFPRHLLMAAVGGKTLTALDLNRYRYSCVFIMRLIELTVLGRNVEVTLFESNFKAPSTREPPSCVGSVLCIPALPDRLAQPRAVMCIEASGVKVPCVPSSLITLLEKA